jgi:hypothetical protein
MVIPAQVRLCLVTRTFSGISKLPSLYLSFLTIFSFSSFNFNFPSCHIFLQRSIIPLRFALQRR